MKIWREPPSPSLRRRPPRHCDREPKAKREAIQGQRATGLLRRCAPRNDDPSGRRLSLFGKTTMQPHSMTSVMQHIVTFSALVIAACAGFLTYWNVREHRNADLVRIGLSVLRVDPEKEKQMSEATRKWALDPIDANAGGVKFSPEARAQLIKKPLDYNLGGGWDNYGYSNDPVYIPAKPAQPGPSSEPPK